MVTVLEMKGIHKSFGPVRVLEGVDFSLRRREVRALLGANGAGKSTLIKILGGVHAQSKGEILLKGERVSFKDSRASREMGISVIYQELSLVPTLTVLENIFLGRERANAAGFLKKADMRAEYERIRADFGFAIDGGRLVSSCSIAAQQMIEIMKAVSQNADIIIMDEPTTSLTDHEKESLFRIIARLKEMGKSVIYISHILEEIFRVADSASIMRSGALVGSYPTSALTKEKITALMTGKSGEGLGLKRQTSYADRDSPPALEVRDLCKGEVVKHVSFQVLRGEIVGFAGLVGAGRTEIVNLIFGVDRADSGELRIGGKPARVDSPAAAISHKIGLIPEDRKHLGLILEQEIYKNATSVQLGRFRTYGLLSKSKELDFAAQGVRRLGVKINALDRKVKELSGGNQQKIVVSKWLDQPLELIIYDEPTKGIDIAAKEDIFKTAEEFARQGVGVIFISSDLEEVLRVADRVVIVKDGKIAGERENRDLSVQDIMRIIFEVEEAAKQ